MATIDRAYLYSIGRVRELEKGLLIQANLDRVLEAHDPLAVLRSVGFFKTTEDHEPHEKLDEVFRRERAHNRLQLHELMADSPIEDIFLLPYDVANLKLLLKGKLTGKQAVKEMPLEEGKFQKGELIGAIFDDAPTRLPTALLDEVKAVTAAFQVTKQFAPLEIALDRCLRRLQCEIALAARSAFLQTYLRRASDLENIATVIRWKMRHFGRDTLALQFTELGELDVGWLERLFDIGWESLAATLKPTPYSHVAAAIVNEVHTETSYPAIGVACANALIDFLRPTLYLNAGLEPLVAFYLAREHELKLVRLILLGKRFGCPLELLRQRVRHLFI